MGNRAAAWTHGFQAMSRSASSVAQACVRRRGRTLVWPNGVQPIAPKAPPTLPRGPRMSARVTPPLAVHRPPVCRCARAVTGPSRMSRPRHRPSAGWPRLAGLTVLCAVTTLVFPRERYLRKKGGKLFYERRKNFQRFRAETLVNKCTIFKNGAPSAHPCFQASKLFYEVKNPCGP